MLPGKVLTSSMSTLPTDERRECSGQRRATQCMQCEPQQAAPESVMGKRSIRMQLIAENHVLDALVVFPAWSSHGSDVVPAIKCNSQQAVSETEAYISGCFRGLPLRPT